MKHSKTQKTPLTDIQRLARKVQAYRLPNGPFDYAVQAQAMNDAQVFFHEVVREARRYHADPEAEAVIESARRLYHAAWNAVFPDRFWEDFERLRAGDAAGLESAIRFLEADLIFFRSGYIKTKLARYIKPPMLKPEDSARLQSVVLSLVERRDDRDFRAYCKLARKADGPELREGLTRQVEQGDFDVKRRVRWVLEALAQKDSMEKHR